MEIQCTRTGCPRPQNFFPDLDDSTVLKTVQQKYCITCGMPLILVGRYLPVRLLGKGGFGAAFLARDRYTPTMRQCVVKQFQPPADLTSQQLQIAQSLFEREGEVLEQLGVHIQIPDLFAFFEITVSSLQAHKEDRFFYLVQEFIDGQDLERELAYKGKFSEDEVLGLLREILPVLKFVHDNGSIHRDIKPSNIMRHRNGRLYLLDFGAVKKAAAGATTGVSPGRSTGIYSMGFAPPEQMAGGQIYPSTDLYALAVTCLQLLTGKSPGELFDTFNNQWNWRQYAQVSDRLAGVLDKMLLSAPNQRFASAQDVFDALNPQAPPTPTPQPVSQIPISPTPPPNKPPVKSPPQPPQPPTSSKAKFSTLEILGNAAFTGFEAGLIFITLGTLVQAVEIAIGIWGMILGFMIFAQWRRIIEKFDLIIIAAITFGLVWFFLRNALGIELLLGAPVLAAAAAIALAAIFSLIYKLLSLILSR